MTNNNISKIHDLRFPFTRLLLLLFTFYFLLVSCDTTEPRNNGVLTLSPLDASSTQIWLKVEVEPSLVGSLLNLYRNNELWGKKPLNSTSSIIVNNFGTSISGYLQPSTNYTFFAQINGIPSNTVNITTMDTTSHDFNWQTFTFGDGSGGSSYLNDVAIVDENNIWAVGMIYENGEKYNAVHWDGSEWELLAIDWDGVVSELRTILAFSANDIILGNVNLLHWNGNHFIQMDIPNEVFLAYQNAMWGLSSDDFYVVGNGGNIAHYQNGYWKKIESGTDVDLTDIYGSDDGNYIWTCGWDYQNGQSAIIEIKSSSPRFIWNENTQNTYRGYLNTVWFDNHEFWLGGSEIRRQSPYYSKLGRSIYLTTSTGWKAFSSDEFIFSIRGFARNNVYLGGEDGGLYHFNGISFRKYIELHDSVNRRRIKHLDASINRLIAVGWLDGQAWIIKQPN